MGVAVALDLMQHDANECVSRALTEVFGYGRQADRRLSVIANCNERTALGWIKGDATPDFVHTMRLITSVPRFAAEVKRITGLEAENHPEFQREWMALARKYIEFTEAKGE